MSQVSIYCPECGVESAISWETRHKGTFQQRYDFKADCTHIGDMIANETGNDFWRQFSGFNHG